MSPLSSRKQFPVAGPDLWPNHNPFMKANQDNSAEGQPVTLPVEDVLDLHAFQPKQMPELIAEYLSACQQASIYSVRIIHGKGTGVLRERIRILLRQSPLVASFSQAPASAGGWGATLVEIKRPGAFETQFMAMIDRGAQAMGLPLDNTQLGLMAIHARELSQWNQSMNLTAICDPAEIADRLFLDVLPVAAHIPSGIRVLDLGSGGGFPGIPLKIIRPDVKMTLLDARRKKVSFLKHLIALMKLKTIEAVHGRAEDHYPRTGQSGGRYDGVISKAVSSLDALVKLSLPLVGPEGIVIAMKGAALEQEIQAVQHTVTGKGLEMITCAYRLGLSGTRRRLFIFKSPASR